ncbi:MAG: PQQ-binding-like beta-propeller repeat protein [Planctomycetota bacterium]|nr:PQQ-binding-like beta-propeller repeat protein [Planctomycetota bacterium]
MKIQVLLAVCCCQLLAGVSFAQTAVGWRGDGTGVFAKTNPPTKWSTTENVVWSAKMSSPSNAHPVIVGDKIFTCSEPFDLVCLSLSDGKELWRSSNSYQDVTTKVQWKTIEVELALAQKVRAKLEPVQAALKELRDKNETTPADDAQIEQLREHVETLEVELKSLPLAARYTLPITQQQYNGYTTATPTSDGRHIWSVFGNRVVACHDLDGHRKWAEVLPDHPQAMWGHSSSPLLIGDKLVVNIEGIVGLDAKTGRQLWRTKYGQSWGSAVRGRIGDVDVALLANGRVLRAADGKVIDRVPGNLADASAVVSNGIAYYVGIRAAAFPFPSQAADKIDIATKWTAQLKGGTFFASPVIHEGLIYAVSTQHVLNVLDADTGEAVYLKRLILGHQPVWPSLCVAGRYLYVSSRDGTTLVLETGREYKEVSRNTLAYFISTPVFRGNRMYVRTSERLYCIGI